MWLMCSYVLLKFLNWFGRRMREFEEYRIQSCQEEEKRNENKEGSG